MTAAKRALGGAAGSPAGLGALMATKPIGRGWDRLQVTVKMTPRRKALMSDIALGMPNGTTPSDAIDRAIEAAWTSGREIESLERRIESLEDTMEAVDGERRRESERALEAIKDMATNLARLHCLIQTLSAQD